MKLRTTKYLIKEGFVNTYRNKLMSLASIMIVVASMIILGIFFVVSANMTYNSSLLAGRPQMHVSCDAALDEAQVSAIENFIKSNDKVKEYKMIGREEAFEIAKQILGDDKDILEGMDGSFLSVKFQINLKDPQKSEAFSKELKAIYGVKKVEYSKEEVELVWRISRIVQISSVILISILLIVALFIISNTIKLTVFARRKEIGIMKYIGAKDWLIRGPFIIEGMLIGLLGAVIAFVLVGLLYSAAVNKDFSQLASLKLLKMNEIWVYILLPNAVVGIVVGAAGSFSSIRKYLRV